MLQAKMEHKRAMQSQPCPVTVNAERWAVDTWKTDHWSGGFYTEFLCGAGVDAHTAVTIDFGAALSLEFHTNSCDQTMEVLESTKSALTVIPRDRSRVIQRFGCSAQGERSASDRPTVCLSVHRPLVCGR